MIYIGLKSHIAQNNGALTEGCMSTRLPKSRPSRLGGVAVYRRGQLDALRRSNPLVRFTILLAALKISVPWASTAVLLFECPATGKDVGFSSVCQRPRSTL